MKLITMRAIAMTALIGLYVLSPLLGLSALVAGFGLLVWHRAPMSRPLFADNRAAND
jgi:hypothetical protein